MFKFPSPQPENNSSNLAIGKIGPAWREIENEGELKLDVFETGDAIIIRSTVAGTRPEDLDIFLNNDMLTIRGKRTEEHEVARKDYHLRECFWGKFSRSLILPKHVETRGAEATLKNGILIVKLPKATNEGNIKVVEKES